MKNFKRTKIYIAVNDVFQFPIRTVFIEQEKDVYYALRPKSDTILMVDAKFIGTFPKDIRRVYNRDMKNIFNLQPLEQQEQPLVA